MEKEFACYMSQENSGRQYVSCDYDHFRADRSSDKAREALEQQARVKGKKGFKPDYNPLMGGGGGGGFR